MNAKLNSLLGLTGALALAFWLGRGTAPSVSLAQGDVPPAPTLANGDLAPDEPLAITGVQNDSAFTYQGQLRKGGVPVNGPCTAAFRLFDAAAGGVRIGSAITQTITPTNGLFTVALDFGWNFNGEARWLETAAGCGEAPTTLTPRTALRPAPYAFALPGMRTVPGNNDGFGNPTMNVIGGLSFATISNTISANSGNSAIGGGVSNRIDNGSTNSAIGGGDSNRIDNSSTNSVIGGGGFNVISGSGQSTIAGGYLNVITSATFANIPGGYLNRVEGDFGLAAGRRAVARHNGAFVWGDGTDATITSTATNQFMVRASGGVTMFTNAGATTGARLFAGSGSWTSLSDRNLKANIIPVDSRAVLDAVAALPVSMWSYASQDAGIRHIGPMAQDFYAAFQVGESDTGISTVDAQGVALAAVQGLNAKLESENAELRARLDRLERNQAATHPDVWATLTGALVLGGAGVFVSRRRK